MKQAVMELYAYLIRFSIRAYEWYQERTFLHILHSITRPTELRYNDLIENISECSHKIDQLALLGAQAEQRDINLELKHVHLKLDHTVAKLADSGTALTEVKGLMQCKYRKNCAFYLSLTVI